MYLENINGPADVKKLSYAQLNVLSKEIREALLRKLSAHGGHFGPNFGMVEATVALHYVFDSPTDKIVFDVSHQSYVHKMLTGRKEAFLDPAHYNDVSGYTNPHESKHDFFTVGHTSTSLGLAAGLAKGRDLQGAHENIIAVIGDGSLSGGEALEGLDFVSELKSNLIIVVNDNQMSIAENHGGLYGNLKELRDSNGKCECNLFRAMGLDYVYVAGGNDVEELIEVFRKVKDTDRPVVVHIDTLKGKGFAPAVYDKESWHFCAPFKPEEAMTVMEEEEAGYNPEADKVDPDDYADLTAEYLINRMKEDPRVVAITSGTPGVIGFTPERRHRAGHQFVDVGIAEEYAVALASGIAKRGGKPVYGVASTFIQRAYDQLSQDLCINNNPAVMLVYMGSLTAMTDVTHLCFFDIPLISNIPNMVYLAPTNREEYFAMLDWGMRQNEHPVAIRVPALGMTSADSPVDTDYSKLNTYKTVHKGKRVAIIGLGSFLPLGKEVCKLLKENNGIDATLINPRFITGTDTELLDSLKEDHELVATLEDGVLDGGFGEKIARHYGADKMKVLNFGARKEFVDRFDRDEFLRSNHLTAPQIAEDIISALD